MALRVRNYPLGFQVHGQYFLRVVMVRVLLKTAFGVLFCLSHKCALWFIWNEVDI